MSDLKISATPGVVSEARQQPNDPNGYAEGIEQVIRGNPAFLSGIDMNPRRLQAIVYDPIRHRVTVPIGPKARAGVGVQIRETVRTQTTDLDAVGVRFRWESKRR